MADFVGFCATDFAAYEEKKWSSNVYTLERMKVKEKFQALEGQLMAGVLTDLVDPGEVVHHLSDEFPNIVNSKKVDSQWLYLSRTPDACAELGRFLEKTELRPDKIFNLAPQEKHAVLALVLSRTSINAGLLMHAGAWVDRRNLAAKLHQSWHREKLMQLLEALPAGLEMGFEGADRPTGAWAPGDLEPLAEELVGDERRFVIWQTWPDVVAIQAGRDFGAMLGPVLAGLAPLYEFIAWSKKNDHTAVGEKIRQEKVEQRKNATAFKAGEKVRIGAGMFSGKVGVVQTIDTKAMVKVMVGKLAVTVPGVDLVKL